MFGLFVFIIITIFLFSKLNEILGMHIGHKMDIKNDPYSKSFSSNSEGSFIEEIDSEKKNLLKNLQIISNSYGNFSQNDFLEKSKKVFEVVFQAYANADKNTLKTLLAPRIYGAFVMAIDDRKSREEALEGTILRFISSEIIDASADDEAFFITVNFITEQSNVLKSRNGEILEGNPDFIEKHSDIWGFQRKKNSSGPLWLLCEIKDS